MRWGSRTNLTSCDNRMVNNVKVKATANFVEHTGSIMGFQIPLLVIDRRGVSIMSGVIPNRRGGTLKGRRHLGIALTPKRNKKRTLELVRELSDGDPRVSEGVLE